MSEELTERDEAIVACPATIYPVRGRAFEVTDVGSWRLDGAGIYATGSWAGSSEEVDAWWPLANIDHVEYHWDQLGDFLADSQPATEAPLPPLALVSDE